jgi:uncharacterized protein (TIGR00725 family)
VGVIGANELPPIDVNHAVELIGYKVAVRQAVFLTGDLTGAKEIATKEAKAAGGLTIGILPGYPPQDTSPYVALYRFRIERSLQPHHRSYHRGAHCSGRWPLTLSEIVFALKSHKPIISLNSWDIADNSIRGETPQEAMTRVFEPMEPKGTRRI